MTREKHTPKTDTSRTSAHALRVTTLRFTTTILFAALALPNVAWGDFIKDAAGTRARASAGELTTKLRMKKMGFRGRPDGVEFNDRAVGSRSSVYRDGHKEFIQRLSSLRNENEDARRSGIGLSGAHTVSKKNKFKSSNKNTFKGQFEKKDRIPTLAERTVRELPRSHDPNALPVKFTSVNRRNLREQTAKHPLYDRRGIAKNMRHPPLPQTLDSLAGRLVAKNRPTHSRFESAKNSVAANGAERATRAYIHETEHAKPLKTTINLAKKTIALLRRVLFRSNDAPHVPLRVLTAALNPSS